MASSTLIAAVSLLLLVHAACAGGGTEAELDYGDYAPVAKRPIIRIPSVYSSGRRRYSARRGYGHGRRRNRYGRRRNVYGGYGKGNHYGSDPYNRPYSPA